MRTVRVLENGRPVERDLERFLAASDTTAFLILRGDTLLYEGYFNGYDHHSTQTSMSIAKSVLSALVGIAIGEGRIGSVDDPITRYAPDLRAAALRKTKIVEEPGRRFHYNNYNPLLVGLALERATGMPVATYLERRLWQPLGMQADGSWSLDSRRSGFEKMESGVNGRAIDFAKLGVLYANGGAWQGRQLLPRAWVQDPTVVPTGRGSTPASGYQYFWWVQNDRSPQAFFARGKYAQHIYVVAKTGLVLVRFGRDFGYENWPELLSDLARRLDQSTSGKTS